MCVDRAPRARRVRRVPRVARERMTKAKSSLVERATRRDGTGRDAAME